MGIYGVDVYGTGIYGPSTLPYLPTFSVLDPTTGKLVQEWWKDQNTLQLGWTVPIAARTLPPTATDIRLVRNSANFPDNENDGAILFSRPVNSNPLFIDRTFTPQADADQPSVRFWYYSFFVLDTSGTWQRGGDVICLQPQRWLYDLEPTAAGGISVKVYKSYCEKLYSLMPQYYQDIDQLMIDPSSTARADDGSTPARTQGPLQRFLCMIGFQLDIIRTEAESLRLTMDPAHMSGGLLPVMAKALGFRYEPEMGMRQSRRVIENLIHLYKIKGTVAGIEGITTTVTGFGASVAMGVNQALDPAGLDFNLTTAVTHQVQLQPYSTADGAFTVEMPGRLPTALAALPFPTTTPVSITSSMAAYTFSGYWIAPTDPAVVMHWTSLSDGVPTHYGIPLSAGGPWTGSLYIWSAQARSFSLTISWYDINGALISTSAASTTAAGAAAWTRASVTATAPSGAVWADVEIVTTTAVNPGQPVYFSLFQWENAASASAYDPPRDIKITLLANRINRIRNPSFETDASHWTQGANTTLARTTAHFYAVPGANQVTPDTASGMVTSTAAGAMQVYTDAMPAHPGLLYTASAYFAALLTAQLVVVQLVFYDATIPTPNVLLTVSSTPALDTVLPNWTRESVAMLAHTPAPAGTASVQVVLNWLSTSVGGEQHLFDCILMEQAASVGDYFDAGLYSHASYASDYVWEGTPNVSESLYYRRRGLKFSRLIQILSGEEPDSSGVPEFANGFVPAGMTYTLNALQPIT